MKLTFSSLFFLTALWICTAAANSQETIEILGGLPEYDLSHDVLYVHPEGDGLASVIWGEQSLAAHEITYVEASSILEATGDVRLWNQGAILRGSHLIFHVDQREGVLDDVTNSELAEGIYFRGKQLEYREIISDEKDLAEKGPLQQYTLHGGALTSNDLPYPYYEIEYDKITLVPGDRLWARNMVFTAQDWPLFYLPIYTRSLETNEVAYYINATHDSNLGFVIYNRLNIEPSKEHRFDIYADYYSDAGYGKGAKYKFDIEQPYGPKGEIYGYHIKQEDDDNDTLYDGADRFMVSGTFQEDLPYDIHIAGQGHYINDPEYIDDYDTTIRYHEQDLARLEREAVSHLSLIKYWDEQSLRVTGSANFDPYFYSGLPYVERRPQVHFEQYPTKIFDTNLYGEVQLDYGRYRREQGSTFPVNKTTLFSRTDYVDEVNRLDGDFNLSYPVYLPDRWTIEPWVGYRGTYYDGPTRKVDDPSTGVYDFKEFNFDSEMRNVAQAGFDLSTRRTIPFDTFLDRYEKMRAVVEPVLSYGYYLPDNDLENISLGGVRYPYIDPVDDFRMQMHHMGAVMRSRIQGKNAAGGTSDFMRLSAGFAYDYFPDNNLRFDNFEYFDDAANQSDYRFSDLVEDFSIYPLPWWSVGNSLRYDIDDSQMRSALYYTNIRPIQQLNINLSYNTFRFPFINADEQQDAALGISYKLSPKYQIYYRGRYDLDEGTFRANDLGIVRDLYDFFAVFEIEHKSHPTLGDELSFHVRFGFWGIGKTAKRNKEILFQPETRIH